MAKLHTLVSEKTVTDLKTILKVGLCIVSVIILLFSTPVFSYQTAYTREHQQAEDEVQYVTCHNVCNARTY